MIFTILKSLALGVWLGSLLMLGIAVAGPIFQHSPSKTLAGEINGVILSRMNAIEWVCGLLALVSSLALLIMNWQSGGNALRITESIMIAISLVLLFLYAQGITSRMNDLRSTIKDFDHPQQTAEYVTAKSEFDTLHKRYTQLVGANMLLITASFVLGIVVATKK